MKIRTRFTLIFAAIVGIILFSFSFAIYYLSEDYRQNDFHSRLQDRGIAKLKLLLTAEEDTDNLSFNQDIHFISNENFVIYDRNKNLLYRDTAAPVPSPEIINSIKPNQPHICSLTNAECIGFIYPYKENTYLIFSSGYDKHGMNYIANLKQILLFRGFIILLIILLCGWLYVGRLLKPISKIVQQAGKITYSNMNQRLSNGNSNDEIGQLTSTFNKMLERLETSFNAQKRFVSNASHELRNPLTAINGQIDVALMKDREKDEYKKTLQVISKDIKNLKTLTNNLLELANNDETFLQHFEEVRIDEILWSIRDEMAKQKPECAMLINYEKPTDSEKYLICKGDEKLLKTAFLNIIDNACKFSNNKSVEIKITPEKTNIILFFTDKGIGMPEAYLQHIFEPFYRGNNTMGIPGNGIGLSLVQRIIKLHSGKIFIRSKLNEGTTVELVIPNLSRF
ncbi:MAG: HAMP domain-containing histidine kinase [Flavobacteriales bacterium]|nr:HAMP domain-containing histidine kinase [Flavobacteriales bacterium]